MRRSLLLILLLVTSQPAQGSQAPRVVVPVVQAHPGVPQGVGEVLTDLLLEALLARHGIRALGPADVAAMLQAEAQRSLLACDQESCMVELAGALGADWLVAGSVGKLEDLYVVSLRLIEADKSRVTARASTTVPRLSEASTQLGPLVDKLLGARPRPAVPAPMALSAPAAPAVPALSRDEFCRQAIAYVADLKAGPMRPALTTTRQRLLRDLLAAPYQQQFDRKRSCFFKPSGTVESVVQTALFGATAPQQAMDARLRYAEWATFRQQLDLLVEAYSRGLEMEKLGTGPRLTALPFAVEPPTARQPAPSAAQAAYEAAYSEGQQLLAAVLQAVRDNNEAAASQLFVPGPAAARAIRRLRGFLERDDGLDPAPLFVLRSGDVEDYHDRFGARHELVVPLRRQSRGAVMFDHPVLVQHQGQWRIKQW